MRLKLLFIILFFISLQLSSQNKNPIVSSKETSLSKTISADCSQAIKINVTTGSYYGPTLPPNGFGKKQEFTTNNSLTFEGEHNSAWYLLSIVRDGQLAFDIVPQDTTNDYDYLLYNYDSTFCDAYQKNKLKPIRSNLSNVKKSIKGITGLQPNRNNTSIGEGIGEAYSKSLEVKKNEKYMLILDNITSEGKGHTIFFYFIKDVEISGKLVGADSIPLAANITLSDNKGNKVVETTSDKNGEYKINTGLKENQNYSLTYHSDETFVQTTTINTKELKGKTVFPNIKTILPKLKKGEKYKLGNINFHGNQATLLPESFPSIEALFKLMSKNKNMIIQIEGHVNDPDYLGKPKYNVVQDNFNLTLSNERAKMIFDYLISKGISHERMKYIGLSNKFPLFKNPKNEEQQSANRRVEIKVISID